jgi:nicotinate-nucleotide adenylyltransferase
MTIGLYFGSFNPIHNGHLHVAHQALKQQNLNEVWFVVSPQNPFKENDDLAPEDHRLRMAQLACAGERNILVCDIEFDLPKPSYTVDTIRALCEKHPEHTFQLIIGEDNLSAFNRWKEFEALLGLVEVIVYPRTNATPALPRSLEDYYRRIHFLTGALIDISATHVRELVHSNQSIQGLAPSIVVSYIEKTALYR